jgi:hypothetical protein
MLVLNVNDVVFLFLVRCGLLVVLIREELTEEIETTTTEEEVRRVRYSTSIRLAYE